MDWVTEALKYVAGFILGGGGLWTGLKLWSERNKTPLDRRAVEVSTAGGQVKMSLDLAAGAILQVQQLRDDMGHMREQFERLEKQADEADKRADEYERRAARAERVLEELAAWAVDVIENWEEYRQHDRPHRMAYIMTLLRDQASPATDPEV